MTAPLGGLLAAPPTIVAAGVDVFSEALRQQGAEVHDVDIHGAAATFLRMAGVRPPSSLPPAWDQVLR